MRKKSQANSPLQQIFNNNVNIVNKRHKQITRYSKNKKYNNYYC